MLSKVLEKSTCAKCKFCCSFRRCSLWETPLFPENTVEKLESQGSYQFDMNDDNGKYGRMHLQDHIIQMMKMRKHHAFSLTRTKDVRCHTKISHLTVKYGL